MKMYKKAFTLGEILMALGIIGIISAITIPQVILSRLSSQAKAEFNTAYSNLSRIVSEMEADGINADVYAFAPYTFYATFKKYISASLDCGTGLSSSKDSPCLSAEDAVGTYKTVDGRAMDPATDYSLFNNGGVVANNGMLYMIENGENSNASFGNYYGLLVSVDINGKFKKPNRLGWDVFSFEIIDGQVIPLGSDGAHYPDFATNVNNYCNANSSTVNKVFAGVTCAYKAVNDDEYFSKLYRGR